MPAALATATAGAGAPRSSRAGGLATATGSAGTDVGVSTPTLSTPSPFGTGPFGSEPFGGSPGPATSTASARPAGAIVSGGRTLPSDFATDPFGYESFGGLPGLSRGRALASPGRPRSSLVLAQATATASAAAGRPTSIARYDVAASRAIAARGNPLDVTALLDQAAAEADRVPVFGLWADWDGDGSYDHPLSELTPVVTEFTVDRSLSSELPDDIGIVSGTAATSLDVTLAGAWSPSTGIPPAEKILGVHTLMPNGAEAGFDPTSSGDYVTAGFTFGLEFSVTRPCQIDMIRYWRPVWLGAGDSPVVATQGGIWDVATQTEVAGTHVTVPTPPSGWGWQDVPLPAPFFPEVDKRYKVALLYSTYPQRFDYFVTGGPGDVTMDFGPLRRYSQADATGGFQSSWKTTSVYGYPNAGDSRGKAFGVDLVATERAWLTGNPNGDDTDPVKALAPYRRDADLADRAIIGRGLSLTTGMQTRQGPITQQRFRGTVSAFRPSSAAREVQLGGLDPVDHLRAPITQAAWGIDLHRLLRSGENGYPARMNSQWYVDRILRANGFFASPPPGVPFGDSRLLLSATMHGSPVAEVAATTSTPYETYAAVLTPATFVAPYAVGDHPFGMLAPSTDTAAGTLAHVGAWSLSTNITMAVGDGYALPIWIRVPGTGDTLPADADLITINPVSQNLAAMAVCTRGGIPSLRWKLPSGTEYVHTPPGYTLPAQAEWQFFGCWWNYTATGGTFSIFPATQGVRTGSTKTFTPISGVTYNPAGPVGYNTNLPLTNVSLYRQPTEPAPSDWVGQTWTKTARIDVGANDWAGILEQRNTESYGLVKEIVGAELGQFGFDEDGVPYFRSRAVAHAVTRSETVTAQRSLVDLVTHVNESTVRNSIDVVTAKLPLQTWEPIFESEEIGRFIIPPASGGLPGVIIYDLPLPDNCAQVWTGIDDSKEGTVLAPPLVVDKDGWNDARENPALANRLIFSGSFVTTPTVLINPILLTFQARQLNSRTMRLLISNSSGGAIRLATPDEVSPSDDAHISPGVPALRIPGRIVRADKPVLNSVTEGFSIARYGRRTYDLGGESVWRQYPNSVIPMAYSVLEWTATPKPVLDTIEAPHHPRRKLYDQVTVVDSEGLGSVTGKLAGIRTTFSENDGARDQLLVRPNEPPLGW